MRAKIERSGEAGFTLVEMMVSILVVGVILSALAATLLAAIRATSSNERETRATAYAQQELEILQSVDWEHAALYENEVAAAPAAWTDRLDAEGVHDGLELITLPTPSDPSARIDSVPEPRTTITDGPGVDYVVDRYITWVDRTEDGTVDTRRFTVVVTWDDRTADRGITVSAERAPTQGDVTATASGARVLQMTVSPNPVGIDDQQRLEDPVLVRVVLNQPSPFLPTLAYHSLAADDETWELRTASPSTGLDPHFVTGGPANTRFVFEIPAVSTRMVIGSQDLLFVGRDAANQYIERYGALQVQGADGLLAGETPQPPAPSDDVVPSYPNPPSPTPEDPGDDEDDGDGDGDDVEVPEEDVTVSVTNVTNLCVANSTWVPERAFEMTIATTGLTQVGGTVTVSYQHATGKSGQSATGYDTVNDGAEFVSGTAAGATYRHSIAAGSNRLFEPDKSVTFTIDARRAGDNDNIVTTRTVTVRKNC